MGEARRHRVLDPQTVADSLAALQIDDTLDPSAAHAAQEYQAAAYADARRRPRGAA
ncbi:hypothetical protein ACWDUL_27755 [Nocardia niigatensis]